MCRARSRLRPYWSDVAQQGELISVEDRSTASGALVDEGFEFGPFSVTEVSRDWDDREGTGSDLEIKGGYSYAVKSNASRLAGKCKTNTSPSHASSEPALHCTCGTDTS